jgi:SAM-dependent methyltransferase
MKSEVIKKCRICNSKKIKKVFSLGNISHAGIFPSKLSSNVPKDHITIVFCENCSLVQLDRNFNLNYMFGKNYGYRSAINKTMKSHLENLTKKIEKKFNIKNGDYVLDIGSNDATLLNSYQKGFKKVGIDPLVKKYQKSYKKIDYKISNFFDAKHIQKLNIPKFKVITALAVLYDLPDPNKFIKDIKKILDKNGVFIVEVADLYLTYKNNIFDTFCHEHLEYYSFTSLKNLIESNDLKIFNHEYLSVNGGSSRYFITHKDSNIKTTNRISIVDKIEKKNKVFKISKLKSFYNSIENLKSKFIKLMINLKSKNYTIHGYGASTKGNVLIQFYNLNNNYIDCIAERNKQKYNCYTPGSKIKIVSEKQSRKLKPDYYVVFPWHFKKEILLREKKMRKKGTKFIFPLPKIVVA